MLIDYFTKDLITYMGNKRKLLGPIGEIVSEVKPKTALDMFCGSGMTLRITAGCLASASCWTIL